MQWSEFIPGVKGPGSGMPGGSVDGASAFGSGQDLRARDGAPCSAGSLLLPLASPAHALAFSLSLSLSLSLINK